MLIFGSSSFSCFFSNMFTYVLKSNLFWLSILTSCELKHQIQKRAQKSKQFGLLNARMWSKSKTLLSGVLKETFYEWSFRKVPEIIAIRSKMAKLCQDLEEKQCCALSVVSFMEERHMWQHRCHAFSILGLTLYCLCTLQTSPHILCNINHGF